MKRTTRLIARLEKYIDRWWYYPILALLAGIDLFIGVIPTDGLLISSVMIQPRNWVSGFLWASFGSALGAYIMSGVAAVYGPAVLEVLIGNFSESGSWAQAERLLQEHGVLAVGLVSISPLPQQPIVAAAGLAEVAPLSIALAVLAGRGAKYGAISWAASHAPHLFRRWVAKLTGYEDAEELVREYELQKRQEEQKPKESMK